MPTEPGGRLAAAAALARNLRRGAALLLRTELLELLEAKCAEYRVVRRLRASHPFARIDAEVLVQGYPAGALSLAPGVSIGKGTMLVLGDEVNGHGSLSVGARTWIGQYNNLRLAGGADILIGEGCLISQFCSLVAANHPLGRSVPVQSAPDPTSRRGIVVGDGVWLGAGAAVLPGVTVGSGAVVGANSVVTKDVGPWEIWAGVPAARIGERV